MAVATALVLLGGSIAPFLAPPVVRFGQDRAGVQERTGFDAAGLDYVTASLLGDLVFWRGDFGVQMLTPQVVDVLSPAERAHMRDVRSVFTGFWALVLAGLAVLALRFRGASGTEAKAAAWRSVASGARGLAIGIAVVGLFAIFAFDAAFKVFHMLFFSGNYTFDPATDHLVQLFPMQFWSEISMAVGLVVVALSLVTWRLAKSRAATVAETVA